MESQIVKDIQRAVKHQSYIVERKSQEQQNEIVSRVIDDISDSNYDFSSFNTIILHRNGKKRLAKQYIDEYSTESILCQHIKYIIDRIFRIRYANRNNIIRSLFSILPAVIEMSGFTIVKFDFQDYFNSLSAPYIFEKYIKGKIRYRNDLDLIEEFVSKTKHTYAGLCTSNAFAELIASEFDNLVQAEFINQGLVFYKRYVDDCIMILNVDMDKNEVDDKLQKCLDSVFHDKSIQSSKRCKTTFNPAKNRFITKNAINTNVSNFDYLGYSFDLSLNNQKNKVDIKYGITDDKQKKYKQRVEKLVSYYNPQDQESLQLLRHRLLAFTCRTVYQRQFFNSAVWRVRGFIANYGELRFFLDTDKIQPSTKRFLEDAVSDAFSTAGIPEPYFLKCQEKQNCGYNLLGNMKRNKTLLLVDRLGYDYTSLSKLCSEIGIDSENGSGKMSYSELVRSYLIKVKVGY